MALSTGNFFVQTRLTHSALLDIFCCNANNVENFSHYFHDGIHHFLIQCRFGVNLQPLEKGF